MVAGPEALHEGGQGLHRLRADRGDVDRVGDHASGQRPAHLLSRDRPGPILRLRRRCTQVRGDDHVVAPEQRMVGERLLREDVERGAADLSGSERRLQGVEVDQLAARAVDDPNLVLHLRDRLGVDPVHGVGGLGQVDRDDVGLRVELVGGLGALDAELAEALRSDELVEGGTVLTLQRPRLAGAARIETDDVESRPQIGHEEVLRRS